MQPISVPIHSNSNFAVSRAAVLLFFALGMFGYALCAVDGFLAIPGDMGDARFNSVILEHVFRWAMGYEKNLWSPPFFYPFEGALAFSDNHFGSSIFYILLRLIGLEREAAFDGWFLIGNWLNFLAAYVAMRRLGLSGVGSAAGAFVFAFALPVLVKEGHAQLVYRFAIPLAYAAFWELITKKQLRFLWQLALWIAVQFYCSIYLGIFLVYLLIATILSVAFLSKWKNFIDGILISICDERKGVIAFTSVVVLLSILAVAWLLYNYYVVSMDYGFKRSIDEIASMLPRLSSYLICDRALLSSWLGQLIKGVSRNEHQLFFGFGVWIFGVFGAVSVWRGDFQQNLGRAAFWSVIILFVVTLNVGGYSLYLLLTYIPGINSIRAVSRIVLVMMWPIGILVAIGVNQLYRLISQESYLKKIAMLAIILALLGAEVVSYQSYKTPITDWISRISALKLRLPEQLPTNSIIFVTKKESEPSYLAELDGMILAQDLGIPTLNGYSGNSPPHYLEPLPCYSYLNRLNLYASHRNLNKSDMKAIADKVVVISPSPCEHEPALAFEGEISADQAKNIILSISDVRIINEKIEATIVLKNTSSTNFFTVSTKPIRLSWRFVQISPSGERLLEPGWDARQDLAWTIAPGNSRQVSVLTDLPKIPGNYLFEVSLVQEGVAWLQNLGMGIASAQITVGSLNSNHEIALAFGGEISADQAKGIILNFSNIEILNEKIEAKIVAHNISSIRFNTLSTIDKPVRLSWRFVQISPSEERLSEPGWDARQNLAWTIEPGDSRQVVILTDLPKIPGNYLFEVSLVQEGVAWLQNLGMGIASVRITVDGIK